jgi:hypothetical protein
MKQDPVTAPSAIAQLVSLVHAAFDFLKDEAGYKLDEIRIVTGGGSLVFDTRKVTLAEAEELGQLGDKREYLHKNSVLKIRELRYALAVRRRINRKSKTGKMHWVKARGPRERGDDNERASMQWLWSPQIDTFERLERLVAEAERLGFGAKQHTARVRTVQELGAKRLKRMDGAGDFAGPGGQA